MVESRTKKLILRLKSKLYIQKKEIDDKNYRYYSPKVILEGLICSIKKYYNLLQTSQFK